MRTTLDLDADKVREVMRLSGAKTKTEAIHRALDAYARRCRVDRLLSLPGRIRYELDWRRLEEEELAEGKGRTARRRR